MNNMIVNDMNENTLKEISYNEYINLFRKGELILNINRLKESYTVKKNGNLVLIFENINLCITYEKDYCTEQPKYYCNRIDLNEVLNMIETKLKKKLEYIKKFEFQNMCNITNDYIFLLK